MEMVNRLTAVSADVRDDPVAVFGDVLGPRQLCRDLEDSAEQLAVGGGELVRRPDVGAWHEQDVRGCLRIDVANRDDQVVLVDRGRRKLAGDDAAEEAVGPGFRAHHSCGFVVIRNPIVPTSAVMAYET